MIVKNLRLQAGQRQLAINHWQIAATEHWAIFGHSGSGKSLLAAWLGGELVAQAGVCSERPERLALVSLAQQQALLEQELAQDETDFTDCVDPGHSVQQLLQRHSSNPALLQQVSAQCDLNGLLERGFKRLSTGETRRLMLAFALLKQPQLLVLDEPFAGLDLAHQQQLHDLLNLLSQQCQLLLISSRDEELPAAITHVALLDEQGLSQTLTIQQWREHPERACLSEQAKRQALALVEQLRQQHRPPPAEPLFSICNGRVSYAGNPLFSGLNWRIEAGQHWQIRGPNGCGKSTLLNLIFGDHPQCYSNQIEVMGYRRGSGESIWQVKQAIGMVSASLHLHYRINCSALEVVLSGFYDSIGVYQQPSAVALRQAKLWLRLFGLAELQQRGFKSLSYGQQRLLIIARALVKGPALLLLDEPCQGLDFLHRRMVLEALERVAHHQLSQLVYVTHHQQDVLPSVTHFIDFVDGQLRLSVAGEPNG